MYNIYIDNTGNIYRYIKFIAEATNQCKALIKMLFLLNIANISIRRAMFF